MTGLTFRRFNSIFRWLPATLRARLHARLPKRLEEQAWRELADEIEAKRDVARDAGFVHVSELVEDELERLRRFPAA